jgi:hypothetical protein
MGVLNIFDTRLVAGEIHVEKCKKFDELRKKLAPKSVNYSYYFRSRGTTVNLMMDVFLNYTKEFLELVGRMESEYSRKGIKSVCADKNTEVAI